MHLHLIICIFVALLNNLIMRRSLYILFFSITFIACSTSSRYSKQLAEVEAIIEDNPDSAKILLDKIPSSLLSQEGDRALYYLLQTMADYKLNKHFSNDSSINYCVSYYKKTNQTVRLAIAYYYKGAINYEDLNRKELAVHCLKKAEELSNVSDIVPLKNKIYELLHNINYNAQNYKLSLQYANLFLESSMMMMDPELISRAYELLSNDYISLGDDKAAKYIEHNLKYAELCSDKRRSDVYENHANSLLGEKRYKEAVLFLEKAVRLHPRPNHYIMLGKIAKQEGDTLQARLHWEKAMTFDNQRFTIKAYKLLGEMYAEQRNYPLAFQMLEKADSVKDAWHEQMRTAQLTEIQHRYDAAILEKALTERKNLWLTVAVVSLIVLLLALLAVAYLSRKTKEYKGIIDEDIEQIYQAEQKIELLQSTGKDYEHEVRLLKEQIGRLKETSAQKLGTGKSIYEAIVKDERIHELTRAREQDFIDYYAYTFSKQFHALILPYQKLTLRHTTYLVMQQMGLDDRKIAELLNVTDSTIRNYRHRLRNPE